MSTESQLLDSPPAATLSLVSPGMGRLSSVQKATHAVAPPHGGSFMLAGIDRFCGQIAAAIHASELQLYATLALIVVLSALLFPPKNDPDQV